MNMFYILRCTYSVLILGYDYNIVFHFKLIRFIARVDTLIASVLNVNLGLDCIMHN